MIILKVHLLHCGLYTQYNSWTISVMDTCRDSTTHGKFHLWTLAETVQLMENFTYVYCTDITTHRQSHSCTLYRQYNSHKSHLCKLYRHYNFRNIPHVLCTDITTLENIPHVLCTDITILGKYHWYTLAQILQL